MAYASAPDFDNVRWGGPDGLRVPQEAGKATLALKQMVTVNGGGSSTWTLLSTEISASELVVTNMGSITSVVSLSAAYPGKVYAFKNSTGSGSTCTLKVSGQTGTAVKDGSHAILVCNATDIERWTADF